METGFRALHAREGCINMSEVKVFLADGFEELEGLTVVDLMRRAGIKVNTVSIMGRKEIHGAHGIDLTADETFENADFSDAGMLVLPGGMPGTLHLKEHAGLKELLLKFNEEENYLAAICAAPTVLGGLGLLEGKKAVCYPSMEDGLTGAKVLFENVVTDGNVTTSRGLGTAIDFALRLIEILKGRETAAKLAEQIVYEQKRQK